MKNNKALFRFFAFYLPILSLVMMFIFYNIHLLEKDYLLSFLYGFIISFTNFLIGFIAINKGITKPDKPFLIIVFGAVILRLFLVFIMIISVLSFLDVKTDYFIFTTFIIYFYYLVVEILYLKNLKNLDKISNNGFVSSK